MKYCILDTSHPVLWYCRGNLHCPFVLFTPPPSPSKKKGGKERGGGKPQTKNAKLEREEKKEVALFGKASRGTSPGSLVLQTEEGAKAARTEGGFQVEKGRG